MMLNHLWQSTLFAIAVWLVSLALRRNRASVRYWLWLAASVKFLLPFSLLVSAGSGVAPPVMPATIDRAAVTVVVEEVGQPFAVAAPAPHWVSTFLVGVWLAGIAIGMGLWLKWWMRMRAARRAARPLDWGLPIPAMSAPGRLEPGVFGIWRPVLLLPDGIGERLTPGQLQAVIAHELCHARRRDNLTAAIHMVVETIFWFHPLVWWIRARLVTERELARDEAVIAQADPLVYAEGILNVCSLYLESPLVCAPGVTGADLKRRIQGIVSPRRVRELSFGGKALLAATGALAVGLPLAIGLVRAPLIHAQENDGPAMSFDVASVKPLPEPKGWPWPEGYSAAPKRAGGRISWITGLNMLIRHAYGLQSWRMGGMEIPPAFYQIDARFDESTTDKQVRRMLQALLRDRFHLEAHREVKEFSGYAMVAAKGGPKLRQVSEQEGPADMPSYFKGKAAAGFEGRVLLTREGPVDALTGRRVTMAQLTEVLEEALHTFVLDRTGLPGSYYFSATFDSLDHPRNPEAPTLFQALQAEMGLRLEKQKGPVEMLIVDRVDRVPAGN
jgi:uncharacterized protein (TIGR03435 family)